MKDLLEDNSINIRLSDKGSGIVVLDTDKYRDDIEKNLLDASTYKQINENTIQKTEHQIKKIVECMYKRQSFKKEMKGYFLPIDTRPGRVQGNPKVHKTNNPLRVIITGRHGTTENIAEFVEKELSENFSNLPSFIKESTDFLNKLNYIPQPLPYNTIMLCLDVKALYPSVPREEAKRACRKALNKRTNHNLPTDDALQLIDKVLENNIFSFNNNHYVQTEGTAIGSKLDMNYACTYLEEWERDLLQHSDQHPLSYCRYVDDVWGFVDSR